MSEKNIKVRLIRTADGLEKVDQLLRKHTATEIIPYARNTPFLELAETVIPDRRGPWASPLYLIESVHITTIGSEELCKKTLQYLNENSNEGDLDILSISSSIVGDKLSVMVLVRSYVDRPRFKGLYQYLGEHHESVDEAATSRLIIPDTARRTYTDKQKETHRRAVQLQDELYKSSDAPLLNQLTSYTRRDMKDVDEHAELIYDLKTRDQMTSTILSYKDFIHVFEQCMRYITSVERDSYYEVIRGNLHKDLFMDMIEAYIHRNYVDSKELPAEDMPAMMKKLDRALFELYIIQDLIDDEDITDIKITAPDSIRVRVKGKAYLSNITFIDHADYARFVTSISVRNSVDLNVPTQTFTDDHDPRYILRFSITAPYVAGGGIPIVHIRKVPRDKLMSDDLIKAGMMDEKIRDYLIDCGLHSRGIVFAGPPGSGKTTALNWFLEDAYESSAEILVIQENDELFAYRRGVMFEHVVSNPTNGERPCSLEQLGQMALVAGANVFVIGEAKGAEICSAIRLSNSGSRTAITIHSNSATDTIDKMVDLAMTGTSTSYEQAKRTIKSFQTIVYLQDFKVQEIFEIVGYDDAKKDMIYKAIYKRTEE